MNDVREEILALAEAGVLVHCVQVPGLIHPNIITFEPFGAEALSSGVLTTYMTQFDACLVTYSSKRGVPIRFNTSLPSRFLIALIAGIPIMLPAGRFEAMEAFVKEQGIGFVYSDPVEAYRIVTSDGFIALKEEVKRKRSKFVLAPTELRGFVCRVVG